MVSPLGPVTRRSVTECVSQEAPGASDKGERWSAPFASRYEQFSEVCLLSLLGDEACVSSVLRAVFFLTDCDGASPLSMGELTTQKATVPDGPFLS